MKKTKEKLLKVLIAMVADEDFATHIKEELHIFYGSVEDLYTDAGSFDEAVDMICDYCKPYIKIAYDMLEEY